MFVAQALFDFSKAILQGSQEKKEGEKEADPSEQKQSEQLDKGKRKRDQEQDEELKKQGGDKDYQQKQQEQEIHYLSFRKGDKILVEHAYESGWWYGNIIKKSDEKGFFPSNYVKTGARPPPPPPKPPLPPQEEQESEDRRQIGADWINQKLAEVQMQQKQALTSEQFQGIKSYKYVKINDKNKNILNGNYVKFDVNTGLAKVPVKDQAPTSKAVRQMGYYFDMHQWNEEKNKNPEAWKSKPDPSKKKKKKLHLIGMGKDG